MSQPILTASLSKCASQDPFFKFTSYLGHTGNLKFSSSKEIYTMQSSFTLLTYYLGKIASLPQNLLLKLHSSFEAGVFLTTEHFRLNNFKCEWTSRVPELSSALTWRRRWSVQHEASMLSMSFAVFELHAPVCKTCGPAHMKSQEHCAPWKTVDFKNSFTLT